MALIAIVKPYLWDIFARPQQHVILSEAAAAAEPKDREDSSQAMQFQGVLTMKPSPSRCFIGMPFRVKIPFSIIEASGILGVLRLGRRGGLAQNDKRCGGK